MSDIHVRMKQGGNRWEVIMHISVPNSNNSVGVNYRTALINSGLVEASVLLVGDGNNGTITQAEFDQVAVGEVIEHRTLMKIDGAGSTNASRVAMLSAQYTTTKKVVLDGLALDLKFFGHTQVE